MVEPRRRAGLAIDGNGYVETDPAGRYGRFDEVLGKGATKTVFRAFDEVNGIEVAWNQAKLCDVMRSPDALQRMYSEVNLLSTLHHESIIRFHTSWIDVGKRTFNFITEMFTSGTLREYRQRYPRVDIRAVKNWACQILHGLVYLHGHDPPVIHRDLKCDNIFVNGHLGQVKIGDLGLAAVLRGSQSAHSVIGTPEFMAPELYEEDYNELVDIYSFGMCMLEMLTSEYPYSECCNPAQIYKKVTSGKLPDAFHRIQDPEARRFIGRCLETASKRSSAKELLLDPFLLSDDHVYPIPMPSLMTRAEKSIARPESKSSSPAPAQLLDVGEPDDSEERTDMRITGKMNPDDDTIFLKVQIADKEGHVRNIYFPFDIVGDTPIDVANEMVKELEITDREPSEIAEMIAQEITILVPDWNHHHEYTYGDDEEDGSNHPFYNPSSPTSSQGSCLGVDPSSSHGFCQQRTLQDWLRDDFFRDDDDDMSSTHSGKYSAVNYYSCNEQENQREAAPVVSSSHKSTRFCPEENPARVYASLCNKLHKHCNVVPKEQSRAPSGGDRRRMMRNKSMVDVRSQLLHRTLVEELNKRMFKTVGAVENIGFQTPSDKFARNASPSSSRGGGRKLRQEYTWGGR